MRRSIVGLVAACAAAVTIWQVIILVAQPPRYLLPTPVEVLRVLGTDWQVLGKDLATTALESLGGFLLALVVGFPISALLSHMPRMREGMMPIIIALKTIPIVALAPFVTLWFGTGMMSKVVVSALICFLPVIVDTMKGLMATPVEFVDMFRLHTYSKLEILWKLEVPNAMPHIFQGLKVASTLSIVGAVVGEFAGANEGLGFVVLVSSYTLDTARMLAAVMLLSVLGMVSFGVIRLVESRLVFWSPEVRES